MSRTPALSKRVPHVLPAAGLVASIVFRVAAASASEWQTFARGDAAAAAIERRAGNFARIYNGTPTESYPAVGGLVIFTPTTVAICTGTLIAPNVVLTAAHCLDRGPSRVVAAFFADGVTERDYEGIAYALHPDYTPGVLAYSDIALLALAEPVTDIAPMPLPTVPPRRRRVGTIVGFGTDELGLIGRKEAGTVKLRRCPRAFVRAGLGRGQLSTSLCWRPKRRGQDTCQGDSGGPLIIDGTAAGVTSGGYPGCPGVLSWDTSVALFRGWIDAHLTP